LHQYNPQGGSIQNHDRWHHASWCEPNVGGNARQYEITNSFRHAVSTLKSVA
jgi:hypothetical protein